MKSQCAKRLDDGTRCPEPAAKDSTFCDRHHAGAMVTAASRATRELATKYGKQIWTQFFGRKK
jgi:hypothetical protein